MTTERRSMGSEGLREAAKALLASADEETGDGIKHPWYSVPPTHIAALRAALQPASEDPG